MTAGIGRMRSKTAVVCVQCGLRPAHPAHFDPTCEVCDDALNAFANVTGTVPSPAEMQAR